MTNRELIEECHNCKYLCSKCKVKKSCRQFHSDYGLFPNELYYIIQDECLDAEVGKADS